jgi:hypothetical protein
MRRIALALLLLLSPAAADDADPGFVLHEWGTFTTVAGSDGVLLEGIHADDHALPDFVHRRALSPEGFAGAMVKMETPVIYLYSDREREVRVRVRFPGGLLTTWYPQVRRMEPFVQAEAPALRGGVLDWGTVKVLAPGLGTEGLRAVDPGDPWALARVPDANILRICGAGLESEGYLFYRGLGRFEIPPPKEGAVRVEGGKDVDAVERTLVEQYAGLGLTRAEATAMVRTWRRSWLETPGTRLLYPLPREAVDALLPLEVSPAPRETVRVLVARVDMLTPEEERRAEATARDARDGPEAAKALGRWAWPLLRRVEKTTSDPETARRAAALARELEPAR